jgi:hypothetical protein
MTLQYIFSQKYLFDPLPTQESRLYIPLIIIFSIMIVASLLMLVSKSLDKNIKSRNFYTFLIPGIFGLIYIFCRYEQLPWLGSRLALAIIIFAFIIWSLINFIWMIRYLPAVKQKQILEDRYLKYLPKKKKK